MVERGYQRGPSGPPRRDNDRRRLALALERLGDVYCDVDDELAGLSCKGCGKCCDFERFGHRLYMSTLEALFMVRAVDCAADPGATGCPYLLDGQCTNRKGRPLGCRTFFCADAETERLHAAHERLLGRIREICDRLGLPWRYLPLREALGSVLDPGA